MHLVSNFYDLPLKSWFLANESQLSVNLGFLNLGPSFIITNGSCVTSLGAYISSLTML